MIVEDELDCLLSFFDVNPGIDCHLVTDLDGVVVVGEQLDHWFLLVVILHHASQFLERELDVSARFVDDLVGVLFHLLFIFIVALTVRHTG